MDMDASETDLLKTLVLWLTLADAVLLLSSARAVKPGVGAPAKSV